MDPRSVVKEITPGKPTPAQSCSPAGPPGFRNPDTSVSGGPQYDVRIIGEEDTATDCEEVYRY